MNGVAGFHISVHVRPPGFWPTGESCLDGRTVSVLEIPAAALTHPFPRTFEEVASGLADLPRLFIEPDGSFVWVLERELPSSPWQVDGMLYDRLGRLLYLELKGSFPIEALTDLLATCGVDSSRCVVQFVRQAVLLDGPEFTQYLSMIGR